MLSPLESRLMQPLQITVGINQLNFSRTLPAQKKKRESTLSIRAISAPCICRCCGAAFGTPRKIAHSAPLALVNETFSKRYYPGGDVLGHSLKIPTLKNEPPYT